MAPAAFPEEEYDDDASSGRWSRSRGPQGSRRWLWLLLLAILLPLLLGAAVAVFAGRPIAFEAVRRMTVRKLPSVEWIDGAELARWREDPGRAPPVVLDARTPEEYGVSHLAGALRIEPYKPLLRPLRGFPKDTAIVVYSSAGYRGARVASWLAKQGYTEVTNLDGGIFRWANEGRPMFRHDRPTTEVHPYNPKWGLLLESKYRISAPPIEKRSAAP
ncbi:MAG: rhodanese-like domain-containing protein [Gemmatimonadales bacterium]